MPSPGPAKPPPVTGPKRGRPPAPIDPNAGPAHRALLEPIRTILFSQGTTLDVVVERSGYSRTRISELLRGLAYFPAWEMVFSIVRSLHLPIPPLRRLWIAAAREAGRGEDWIRNGLDQVAHPGELPPPAYVGFTLRVEAAYADYARAFLLTDSRTNYVISESFDMLWVLWDDATTNENLHHYAWELFRSRVMTRAPRHHDGRLDLRAAVFSTHELHDATTPGHLVDLAELIDLFDAITRLSDSHMDVAVLRHLCGLPQERIAEVLGHTPAYTHSVDHHARFIVETFLTPPTPE